MEENLKKEKKSANEIGLGIKVGLYTIVWSWVSLIIPALGIQFLGINNNSFFYNNFIAIMDLVVGIIGVYLALKAAFSSSKMANDKSNTVAICATITTTVVNFFTCGILPLVPYKNYFGLIIMFVVYAISNFILIKKYK